MDLDFLSFLILPIWSIKLCETNGKKGTFFHRLLISHKIGYLHDDLLHSIIDKLFYLPDYIGFQSQRKAKETSAPSTSLATDKLLEQCPNKTSVYSIITWYPLNLYGYESLMYTVSIVTDLLMVGRFSYREQVCFNLIKSAIRHHYSSSSIRIYGNCLLCAHSFIFYKNRIRGDSFSGWIVSVDLITDTATREIKIREIVPHDEFHVILFYFIIMDHNQDNK